MCATLSPHTHTPRRTLKNSCGGTKMTKTNTSDAARNRDGHARDKGETNPDTLRKFLEHDLAAAFPCDGRPTAPPLRPVFAVGPLLADLIYSYKKQLGHQPPRRRPSPLLWNLATLLDWLAGLGHDDVSKSQTTP